MVSSVCVSCAKEALEWVQAKPDGVGIDAPLWWSAGPSGDRFADQWIRKKYKIPSGTVQAANSLRGAALVQAALFVEGLRRNYRGVRVTEAHPKALLKDVGGTEEFCRRYSIDIKSYGEHERDALIAPVAAKHGFSRSWTHDLSKKRHSSEQNPATYW